MLDLTVPMVEVWFAGAKLGEYASDVEALKAASLHADSLPLLAESVEYEIRRDTMKYIVHRRITGPDAPALGPVLTISSSALTVTLDRPASGPTSIDRYEIEQLSGSTWNQIASGIAIFSADGEYPVTGLTASTLYEFRCRAVDTTERASEWSYAEGTTSAGAVNQAPVWDASVSLTIKQGESASLVPYVSDPEGDPITFSKIIGGTTGTTVSLAGVISVADTVPVAAYTPEISASDGDLSAVKTINLEVTAKDIAPVERVVFYDGSFANGKVPSSSSLEGGGYFACKYQPEGGVNTFYVAGNPNTWLTGMDGLATDARLDGRVLTKETWNGEVIKPRSGTHFMRQVIYYTKQYECLNRGTDPNVSLDKPRVKFDQFNSVYRFEWDQEVWEGFSIRVPLDHVGDIATQGNGGGNMVWVLNAGDDFSQAMLRMGCASGENVEKWWFAYQVNRTSVGDLNIDGATPPNYFVDLGSTSADKGLWTDFVFRYRLNPFLVATNASTVGGKNQVYQGNQGILQIWKGTGAADPITGNRTMTRFCNIVNAPVGGVPHATAKLQVSHRSYKGGWKKNPTTSTAPIYLGWDEIRWGFADSTVAASKGQSRASISSDVSPSGEVLT